MNGTLILIGMSLGGWLGWLAGAWISFFTGYITMVLGIALGLYLTRRMIRSWLP